MSPFAIIFDYFPTAIEEEYVMVPDPNEPPREESPLEEQPDDVDFLTITIDFSDTSSALVDANRNFEELSLFSPVESLEELFQREKNNLKQISPKEINLRGQTFIPIQVKINPCE